MVACVKLEMPRPGVEPGSLGQRRVYYHPTTFSHNWSNDELKFARGILKDFQNYFTTENGWNAVYLTRYTLLRIALVYIYARCYRRLPSFVDLWQTTLLSRTRTPARYGGWDYVTGVSCYDDLRQSMTSTRAVLVSRRWESRSSRWLFKEEDSFVSDIRWWSPRSGHHADSPVPSTKLRSAQCEPLAGGRAVDRTHSNRRRLNIRLRLVSSADPPWKDVTVLTFVGFSVAFSVADSSDLHGRHGTLDVQNGHPRTRYRTQPTRTSSNPCAEAIASTLLPVDLNVAPPSSDVGAVVELDYTRCATLKSPSASLYQFSVGLFPTLRRRRRPRANDSLPCTASAVALHYRVILLLALLTPIWGSTRCFWLWVVSCSCTPIIGNKIEKVLYARLRFFTHSGSCNLLYALFIFKQVRHT